MKLGARLDTAQAGPLAAAILEHAGQDLQLDATEVTHFGAMGLQVIRAAAKSWQSSGHALSLAGLSEDCIDQIGLLGFAPDTICRWENG